MTTDNEILFKKVHPEAQLPRFATDMASGADLFSVESITLDPGQRAAVSTGLVFDTCGAWLDCQVRPRSGMALKHGVTVLNSPGTIDNDYVGEIKVILINHGDSPYRISVGDRIAQMVFSPMVNVNISETESVSDTVRGAGGFGSTGQ
jgi:dUTP pyrophosphatase